MFEGSGKKILRMKDFIEIGKEWVSELQPESPSPVTVSDQYTEESTGRKQQSVFPECFLIWDKEKEGNRTRRAIDDIG